MIKPRYVIGIDPGTFTGFAIWDRQAQEFTKILCLMIHQALDEIREMQSRGEAIEVRIEDSRTRSAGRHFAKNDPTGSKAQGAGSIKRDCTIWDDAMKDWGIPYKMISTGTNITKLDAKRFVQFTKYTKQTNQHGRDAAMIVFKA